MPTRQLPLAVGALDTARELAERAAIRAAQSSAASSAEGAVGSGSTDATGHAVA
jgi:hypothetical protein